MAKAQSQRLSAEQRLQQRLTPLQVQFVRMLEMPEAEAEEEVRRALDELPALEAVERDETADTDATGFNETARDMQMADYSTDEEVPDGMLDDSRTLTRIADLRPVSAGDSSAYPVAEPATGFGEENVTLFESLMTQLSQSEGVSPDDLTIGRYIIGNLDPNGYMDRTLQEVSDDIAISEGIDISLEDVRRVVELVRGLDPAGVGATDLRDCLILQLRRMPRTTETVTALEILNNYFDLFSKKHFDRIRTALGISPEALREALAVITRLNPKPGATHGPGGIGADTARHITPDFVVEADNDTHALTLSMPSNIPELQIERSFTEEMEVSPASGRRSGDAGLFIRRNRNDARNFIRLVSMRRETLWRVMSAILKLQHDFFATGDETLIRPMVLRDIAALTGYDLSVISRATQGKYVATSGGIYPLKFFFNERTKDTPDAATTHGIIARIRSIIAEEDKSAPLSDEQITSRLADAGLDIARRTVAKYRERLGFPVARLRRQI